MNVTIQSALASALASSSDGRAGPSSGAWSFSTSPERAGQAKEFLLSFAKACALLTAAAAIMGLIVAARAALHWPGG